MALIDLPLKDLLLRRKFLRSSLAHSQGAIPVRIALLGGGTTYELVKLLELWLLECGFAPEFYEGEFGSFYVETVHNSDSLVCFKPDVVYLHTSVRDIVHFPPLGCTPEDFNTAVQAEVNRFREVWSAIEEKLGCLVIQNNCEFPLHATLGNLDAVALGGHTRFVNELNREFAIACQEQPSLILQDVCSISARIGLANWFDPERWFSYKLHTTLAGSRELAISITALVRASYGKTCKALILDLDNTLWGGVIGDDGVAGLQIGRETPMAEAYTAFQQYCLQLRTRGILLAVASKNTDSIAREGFSHPDSVLKLSHFSSFQANWNPKHESISRIAEELNLGTDSFVFADDNPAERAIVAGQVAGIAVPELGDDVTKYAAILQAGRYFEVTSLSQEDLSRAALYQERAVRSDFAAKFSDYGAYLQSLQMTAEIDTFKPVYMERIAQLTNKTNQFNLTTRRYTLGDIQAAVADPSSIGLYCRLSDIFGDHGLISVALGRMEGSRLQLDLWLMSCRVLKRDVEHAMLDALVDRARQIGATHIDGVYIPTQKNGMVADLLPKLGFSAAPNHTSCLPGSGTVWTLTLANYQPQNRYISILETVHARTN